MLPQLLTVGCVAPLAPEGTLWQIRQEREGKAACQQHPGWNSLRLAFKRMKDVWKTNTAECLDIPCHGIVIDILQGHHIRLTLPKLRDLLCNRANPIINVPGDHFHKSTHPPIFRSKV